MVKSLKIIIRLKTTCKKILQKIFQMQIDIDKINKLHDEGHEIIYWTARGGHSGLDWHAYTRIQLNGWGCEYTRIEKEKKPSYDLYIDDKSVNVDEFWKIPSKNIVSKKLTHGAKIFLHKVSKPELYGVAKINNKNKIIGIKEKPKKFYSDYAITGLYYFDNNVIKLYIK